MAKDNKYYAEALGGKSKIYSALEIASSSSPDFLRRLNIIIPEERRNVFFDAVDVNTLAEWISTPPISTEVFDMMNELDLLPMPKILTEKRVTIQSALEEISSEHFNINNPLHKELEYSKYVIRGPPIKKIDRVTIRGPSSFEEFKKLQVIDHSVMVYDQMLKKARANALEAIAVYDYIVQNKKDNPVLVIGNARYGTYFVTQPLNDYLKGNGFTVIEGYTSSFDLQTGSNKIAGVPNTLWDWITKNNPDIFVIDGTQMNTDMLRSMMKTRFPSAIIGYTNSFSVYNMAVEGKKLGKNAPKDMKELEEELQVHNPSIKYKFNFWAPEMTEKFMIGSIADKVLEEYLREGHEGERDVHFISSVGRSDNSSDGYFDDPENAANRLILGFGNKGLTYTAVAPDEKSLVKKVQEIMKKTIKKKLTKEQK